MPKTYIFMGPPGSGKDTQATLLKEKFGFEILSPGELLREEAEAGTQLGQQINDVIDAGELVADEIVDAVTRQRLQKWADKDIIITGSPRRHHQVAMIDNMLSDLGRDLTRVVYLKVEDEDVIDRLSGRLYAPGSDRTYHRKYNPPQVPGKDDITGEDLITRDDDKPEAVKNRLEIFHNDTQPVVKEYDQRGVLTTIDGSGSIEEVHQKIIEQLKLDSN